MLWFLTTLLYVAICFSYMTWVDQILSGYFCWYQYQSFAIQNQKSLWAIEMGPSKKLLRFKQHENYPSRSKEKYRSKKKYMSKEKYRSKEQYMSGSKENYRSKEKYLSNFTRMRCYRKFLKALGILIHE